jgi:hypothetical protein
MDSYDKRFGMIAIEKGFITVRQLLAALAIQINENVEKETHRLIGEILFEQGIMTRPQIDEVLSEIIFSPDKG